MIFGLALLLALLLVPLGLAYGAASRVLLVRRERWARQNLPAEVDGRMSRASAGVTRLQVADRWVTIGLLIIGGYLLPLDIVYDRLDAQGFVFGNTTTLGNWLLAADGIGFLGILLLLVAIPLSAVIITRRIRDREVLLGEAFALGRRGGRPGRIRRQRALSWIVFLAYAAAAIVAILRALP